VRQTAPAAGDAREELIAFYDSALPHVYGYLSARCSSRAIAEEITAEVFLAAVDVVRRDSAAPMTVPWAIGVARHKLVDHWRRESRRHRGLRALAEASAGPEADDPWEMRLDALRARQVLDQLAPTHKTVLTLRYLDDLPVPEVAVELGRTLHATEALLVRAKAAFRRAYEEEGSDG
jgi:RNA polymerase sigma-70 factor (ECF subfamily)